MSEGKDVPLGELSVIPRSSRMVMHRPGRTVGRSFGRACDAPTGPARASLYFGRSWKPGHDRDLGLDLKEQVAWELARLGEAVGEERGDLGRRLLTAAVLLLQEAGDLEGELQLRRELAES